MYRRTIEKWTIAKVSYTNKEGKREVEKTIKFNGVEAYNNYTLYKILCTKENFKKPYVHEIIKTYYWEE